MRMRTAAARQSPMQRAKACRTTQINHLIRGWRGVSDTFGVGCVWKGGPRTLCWARVTIANNRGKTTVNFEYQPWSFPHYVAA